MLVLVLTVSVTYGNPTFISHSLSSKTEPRIANVTTGVSGINPSYYYYYTPPWTQSAYGGSLGPYSADIGYESCALNNSFGYDHSSVTMPTSTGLTYLGFDVETPMYPNIDYWYCSGMNHGLRTVWAGVHGAQFTAWKSGTASYTITVQWTFFINSTVFGESILNGGCGALANVSIYPVIAVYPLFNAHGTNYLSQQTLAYPCVTGNWWEGTGTTGGSQDVQFGSAALWSEVVQSQVTFQASQNTGLQARTAMQLWGTEMCVWSWNCYSAEPEVYVTAWANFIGIS